MPKREERGLDAALERPHVLTTIEATPQQSRVAEHHEQRVADVPVESELREADVRLAPRRRLKANDGRRAGIGMMARTHASSGVLSPV